jgi:hypothetical protein
MLLFSINRSRGYEKPSLDIIVIERCSIGGFPLEEACEHCYLIQSAISVAISYIISVYCEDYAGYFTVILSFLAFCFCSSYFIYIVSCRCMLLPQTIVPFHSPIQNLHLLDTGLRLQACTNIVLLLVLQVLYLDQIPRLPPSSSPFFPPFPVG